MWCVAKLDEAYKTRMNGVLRLYERKYDALEPVVCIDEKSVELRSEVRATINGKITRRDSEYRRQGTTNVFVMIEPKGGRHYARVTKRRTKEDFAKCLKWLAARYKSARKIHLVMDNLNTHKESSLTETFGKVEGSTLWKRFKAHYTPIHGSWLNQAEIGICVMSKCCLGKNRHATMGTVRKKVLAFWRKRRAEKWKIDWRFTVKKAKEWVDAFQSQH
jgi:hypothetical protein